MRQKLFSDEDLIEALKASYSLEDAGQKLGGVTKGAIQRRTMLLKKKVRLKNGRIANLKKNHFNHAVKMVGIKEKE